MSCKYGLFTWNALHLIQMYERQKENPEIKLASATHLWREYARYREETGVQRLTKNLCSNCGEPPGKDKQMKACSGHCVKEKKPVYCNRECQKAVSSSGGLLPEIECNVVNRLGLNTRNGASWRKWRVKWIGPRILNGRIGSTAMIRNLTSSVDRSSITLFLWIDRLNIFRQRLRFLVSQPCFIYIDW